MPDRGAMTTMVVVATGEIPTLDLTRWDIISFYSHFLQFSTAFHFLNNEKGLEGGLAKIILLSRVFSAARKSWGLLTQEEVDRNGCRFVLLLFLVHCVLFNLVIHLHAVILVASAKEGVFFFACLC